MNQIYIKTLIFLKVNTLKFSIIVKAYDRLIFTYTRDKTYVSWINTKNIKREEYYKNFIYLWSLIKLFWIKYNGWVILILL